MTVDRATPDEQPHSWHTNRQAFVHTAADETFGLHRRDTATGRQSLLRPGPSTHGADGLPVPGLLFLLADSTLGAACIQAISEHDVVVTSNLHIDLHATPFLDATPIRGEQGPAKLYQGTASAAGDLIAADQVVATASGRFAVLHAESRTGGTIKPSPITTPAAPAVRRAAGLVSLPIHETLEAEIRQLEATALSMTVVASPRFANERSGIHGGVGALIGERACDALIRHAASSESDFRTTELRAAFLRPVAADGTRIECIARVEHLGRRLVAVTATLYTPAGAPAVVVDMLAAGVSTRR